MFDILQNVLYLLHFVIELCPFLGVIGNEGALSGFLGDNDKGTDFGIGSALIVLEIALGQKLHIRGDVMVIGLSAEDVLLLQGIAFTKGLEDMIQHVHKGIVLVCIGAVLLHGVLYLEDRTAVACLAIQHGIYYFPPCIGDVLDARKKSVQCVFPSAHTDDDSV